MKRSILAGLFLLVGMASALAEEVGARIQVNNIDHSPMGAEVVISPESFPNGIFVEAKKWSTQYPTVMKIVSEKFKLRGFKLANSPESADAVIRVISTQMSFSDIETNESTLTAQQKDAIVGSVIGAITTGGISLLAFGLPDLSNEKPRYADFMVRIMTKDGKDISTLAKCYVKSDSKNNAVVNRAFLEIMADEWLKAHVAQDKAAQQTATQKSAEK